ncbi:hypothetical protein GCM10027039_42630 [Terrabacter koreensis]
MRSEKAGPTAYVARTTDQCKGVEVTRVIGLITTRVACVETDADLSDGRVSLSVVETDGWLTVADATWRSGADLTGWRATA